MRWLIALGVLAASAVDAFHVAPLCSRQAGLGGSGASASHFRGIAASKSLPGQQLLRGAAALPRVGKACSSRGHALSAARMEAGVGDLLQTPETLQAMMVDAAGAVSRAMEKGAKRIKVEVPLPITGGTELDDWPGGIGQKYQTLRPMVAEMLKTLNFTREEMESKKFLGYVDDAIGIWEGGSNLAVVCFPTQEVCKDLEKLAGAGKTVIVVNSQFFIDPLSPQSSRDWEDSLEQAYELQSLNMKGPGLLPVKGVLLRCFPTPFTVARKLEGGDRKVIATYEKRPARKVLDDLFFKDSEERDKGLSMFDRLKKLQQDASNI